MALASTKVSPNRIASSPSQVPMLVWGPQFMLLFAKIMHNGVASYGRAAWHHPYCYYLGPL